MFAGKSDVQVKLDTAKSEVNSKFSQLEDVEKKFCRDALIQERGRFCDFIGALKPVVVSMMGSLLCDIKAVSK